MSPPLYLLRRSTSSISSALYTPDNRNALVYITKSLSGNRSGVPKAGFLQIGIEEGLTTDEPLTYAKLLEILLKADKVVTL